MRGILCYRKSGCPWRVGRLQRNNRAGSACGNKGITQELLIPLPVAVRALPARPVCCRPMSASSSGGVQVFVQCRAQKLSRNACRGGWLEAERRIRQRGWRRDCREILEPLVFAEKDLRVAQLFLWCPQMAVGSHHVSVCHVGEK